MNIQGKSPASDTDIRQFYPIPAPIMTSETAYNIKYNKYHVIV